jgi:hypothetical protein
MADGKRSKAEAFGGVPHHVAQVRAGFAGLDSVEKL